MSVLEKDREAVIKKLGLRPELTDLLLYNLDCGAFSSYFVKPEYFYANGSPDSPGFWPELGDRNLLPLWEHFEKIYAIDIKNNRNEGVSFYIESPEKYETFRNIDKAIFKMIELHVWEYGGTEKEIEESIQFAKKVSLPNLHGLKNLFENFMECTDDMIKRYSDTL